MITDQERESVRGTMKPKHELSAKQLREIAAMLKAQADEYYALADHVQDGTHRNYLPYLAAVDKYYDGATA